ncbi:unnamed protein product [Phaeothamnion confervicola]
MSCQMPHRSGRDGTMSNTSDLPIAERAPDKSADVALCANEPSPCSGKASSAAQQSASGTDPSVKGERCCGGDRDERVLLSAQVAPSSACHGGEAVPGACSGDMEKGACCPTEAAGCCQERQKQGCSGNACPSAASGCSGKAGSSGVEACRSTSAAGNCNNGACCGAAVARAVGDGPTAMKLRQWIRIAYALAFFTIVWNVIEGVVAVVFGSATGSVALSAFGVDSFVEVLSAGVVLWRLPGELFATTVGHGAESAEAAAKRIGKERKATYAVGGLLLCLAAGTIAGATWRLVEGSEPSTDLPSLVVSLVSLSFMGALYWGKLRTAHALDSRTLAADARCSLGCIQLSLVLFGGAVLFMLVPQAWWVDSAASLVIAAIIGRDGALAVAAARRPDFQGGCPCCQR